MLQDIRLAFRMMGEHKGFALAALLTLALGIGANAAIFSVVYGVLLRPLPYPEPDRLVRLSEHVPGGNAALSGSWFSNVSYYAWEPRRSIGPIATYGSRTFTAGFDTPARIVGASVSPSLFEILRVSPSLGRFFSEDEGMEDASPVVILSDGLWRERFGGDPAAIGRSLTLDGRSHLVVGVAPPAFAFPHAEVRLWTPSAPMVRPDGPKPQVRVTQGALARLAPGFTAQQAAAEGTAAALSVARPLAAEMLLGKGGPVEVRVRTMIDEMTANVRPALLVLLAGVGCLLLIACANVANLFLSRGVARERELAVRTALGARPGRLVRQLLTESLVIAMSGGTIGLALAWALMRVLPAAAPADFPRLDAVHLDWRATAFAAAIAIMAGTLSGLIPALRSARPKLLPALREGAGASSGITTARFRRALLVAESALAVMLLVGAGLLARSFVRLVQVDAGFDASNVLTARVYLPGSGAGQAQSDAFVTDLLSRLRAIPGVVAAGAGNMAPLGDSTYVAAFTLPAPGREPVTARGLAYVVTPGYGEALRLLLRAGRLFDDRDLASGLQSMVVNEAFAHTFLQGLDPIGLQFPSILAANTSAEIIGVVGNVLKDGLDRQPQPEVYVVPAFKYSMRREINLVVRTAGNPLQMADGVRALVRDVRPDAAVDNLGTLASQVSASVGQPRFAAAVLAGFATVALILAAVGLYGVLSYTVSRRQREIGVRSALGASRASLVGLVLREGMGVTLAGLALGLLGAAGLTRLMQTLLFGVEPLDPLSFALAPVVLVVVALVACIVPARRAAAVDPAIALRYE